MGPGAQSAVGLDLGERLTPRELLRGPLGAKPLIIPAVPLKKGETQRRNKVMNAGCMLIHQAVLAMNRRLSQCRCECWGSEADQH